MPLTIQQEMIRYLKRIKHQLDAYIPNHPGNLDPSTVGSTELLCPADNAHDRERIAEMMHQGVIFQHFSQDERECVLERLSRVNGRILSLRTFVSDTILLDTWSKALRHILPRLNVDADIESLFRERFNWDNDVLQIETTEGKYISYSAAHLDAEARFRLCYNQLWMWSGRNFSRITDKAPKKDARSKKPSTDPNEAAPYMLAAHAWRIGFASIEIDACAALNPHAELTHGFLNRVSILRGSNFQTDESVCRLEPLILSLLEDLGDASAEPDDSDYVTKTVDVPRANRCGIPLGSMLEVYQKRLYLPLLCSEPGSQNDQQADSLYVVRDVFKCFFGCIEADVRSLFTHGALALTRSPAIVRPIITARQGRYISPSQLITSRIGRISQTSSVRSESIGVAGSEERALVRGRTTGHDSATSGGDILSYYYGLNSQTLGSSDYGELDHGMRQSWFFAHDTENVASLDFTFDKIVFLLPEGLIFRIDQSRLSPISQMAKNNHAFLISKHGSPKYVGFGQVRECLLGNMPLIVAHKKGFQQTKLTESVLHDMESLFRKIESSLQSTSNGLTFTRSAWRRLLGSIFGR